MAGNKVAVLADSIACIPSDLKEKYGIGIIPLNFYADGRIYKDGIDVNPYEAYKIFLQDQEAFKTSSASPGDCQQAYRDMSRQGKDILCILLSSKLSALYDTACKASEQIKTEFPNTSIIVMDSQTAAAAEGLIALAAARMASAGKSLDEIRKATEKVRDKVNVIAYMDTVRYIYRSGRIPKIAAVAGSMLQIKPMFVISSGMPRFMGAVRSKKIGIKRMLEGMKGKVGTKPVHIAVMHVYAEDDAIKLRDTVAKEFNCVELWLTEFSPIMGYACGTGTLGLAFYPED
ncbi:MAG: DegV family protein [Dehalococcoidales bacterium]|nr:DegV family protein [Dehalococcoidales bacterium]